MIGNNGSNGRNDLIIIGAGIQACGSYPTDTIARYTRFDIPAEAGYVTIVKGFWAI